MFLLHHPCRVATCTHIYRGRLLLHVMSRRRAVVQQTRLVSSTDKNKNKKNGIADENDAATTTTTTTGATGNAMESTELLNGSLEKRATAILSTKDQVQYMRQTIIGSQGDKKENLSDGWETLWQEGITPWDLGGPTKVLISEVHKKMTKCWQQEKEEEYYQKKKLQETYKKLDQLYDDETDDNDDDLVATTGRKKDHMLRNVLIPGCGAGYDLVALARYVDEMYKNLEEDVQSEQDERTSKYKMTRKNRCRIVGLEISQSSLERAREVIETSLDNDGPLISSQIELYEGDFFTSSTATTWKRVYSTSTTRTTTTTSTINNNNDDEDENIAIDKHKDYIVDVNGNNNDNNNNSSFDLIVDYLFFCAIPPTLRDDWGQQTSRLLRQADEADSRPSHGQLLTIMFPFHQAKKHVPIDGTDSGNDSSSSRSNPPGPPFPVSLQDYQSVLQKHGLELQTPLPYASLDTHKLRQGQEVIGWWSFR